MPPTLKSAVTYSHNEPPEVTQLLRLFHQAPWAKDRSADDAKAMLQHTDVVLCAWDRDQLIGYGRVLTDFVYRATIWDVIVDLSLGGLGLGRSRALLDYVMFRWMNALMLLPADARRGKTL